MLRKLGLSLIVSLMLMGVSSAFAGWIWADPEWDVAGTRVLVDVAYHLPDGTDIGPLVAQSPVTLYVPAGVEVTLVNDHGMVTAIERVGEWDGGDIDISAGVETPANYNGNAYRIRLKMEAGHRQWHAVGESGKPLFVDGLVKKNR